MVPDISFSGLVLVALVGFAAPLLLGFFPRLRLPEAVLQIAAGIAIGPAGLGWVHLDLPIQVMTLVGLAFLLLLAGLEVDLEQLGGRLLTLSAGGFAVSFAIALAVGFALGAAGLVETPLLVAIMLAATSLGVVIPVLKDAGESGSPFGQLVLTGASLAGFGTILLLSLFFSREASGAGTQVVLIGGLVLLALATLFTLRGVERWSRLSAVLLRLQDTTAQIRVRGAFLLLAIFAALAERLGLEVILGAFVAGIILKLVDRDEQMTHAQFQPRLQAIGFGVFVPFFFVSSGLRFDAAALFASPATLALVPLVLLALLLVRGLPALLYRPLIGARRAAAAGLLQATSLGFIVVAAQIGMELGLLGAATGAALVAAGLLSVLLFPLTALSVLRGGAPRAATRPELVGAAAEG